MAQRLREQKKPGEFLGDAELTALGMGTTNCVPGGDCTAKRMRPKKENETSSVFNAKSLYLLLNWKSSCADTQLNI